MTHTDTNGLILSTLRAARASTTAQDSMTALQISRLTGLGVSTVRNHLIGLRSARLVRVTITKSGDAGGRPANHWESVG